MVGLIVPASLTPRVGKRVERKVEVKKQEWNPYGVPEDFRAFARTCQIRSGVNFIPFELFDYQEEISRLIDRCVGIAVIKTRQTGFSETVACKMLHRSLLNPAYLGVAFSLGQAESSKLSDRVGLMPGNVEGFSWQTDSKTARKAARAGELLFRPATPNAARSLASVTDLFFDECAFPPDIEEMYGNATPAQSMTGDAARRILGTTIPPEGLSCWFGMTFWNDLPFDLEEEIARVQEGRGRQDRGFSYWIDSDGWARILLHWQSHPIYAAVPNYLQKVKQKERLTEDQLQREHNLGIPKTGGSLFNLQFIKDYAIGQYEPPKRRHCYLAGLDPNMGGEDEWYLTIWDITTHPFKLVAEYHESLMLPSYCRKKTLDLLDEYKPVLLGIEKNNGGLSQAEDIILARPKLRVEVVNTSRVSKIVNTDRLSLALSDGDVIYPAESPIVDQMRKFSRLEREAITGHDDGICSWMVAFAFLEEALTLRPKEAIVTPVSGQLKKLQSIRR